MVNSIAFAFAFTPIGPCRIRIRIRTYGNHSALTCFPIFRMNLSLMLMNAVTGKGFKLNHPTMKIDGNLGMKQNRTRQLTN